MSHPSDISKLKPPRIPGQTRSQPNDTTKQANIANSDDNINTAFDSLVTLENHFHSEGISTADTPGTELGLSEGHKLGWEASVTLISELQFIYGAAQTLLSTHEQYPELIPERCLPIAKKIVTLTEETALHTRGNDPTIDMEQHAETLRQYMRQMTAFARLPLVRFSTRASRLANLDF